MRAPDHKFLPYRSQQAGNSLIVVLVVLTLLALASFGAMRSADTGNVISGNFAFQQATTHASDRAVTDALAIVEGIVAGGGGNANVNNRYSALRTPDVNLDARGIPNNINWDAVDCVDDTGAAVVDCATDAGNFRIQYFIERLCNSTPNMADAADIRAHCEYEPNASANAANTIALRYRVLIRVRGPRGTEGWYEAMLSGPAI